MLATVTFTVMSNPLVCFCLLFEACLTNIRILGKFIPTRRTPGVSTSELLERIVSGYRRCEFDEKLTKMGLSELRAEGSDYDSGRKKSPRSETNGDTKK